jgi:hypothetical protein
VKSDRVRLFLTSITVREVKRHIRKKVKEASNTIDKFRKDLRILANSANIGVSSRGQRLEEKAVVEELTAQFDEFIKQSRAEILECDDINPELVFSKYFEVKLPFEEREEKRREFPDAFAIEVLKAYASQKSSSMTCISGDKGFSGAAKAAGLSIFNTVEEFLDSENREWDAKVTEHVTELYRQNVEVIKRAIEKQFADASVSLSDVDGEVEESEIRDLAIDDDPLVLRIDRDSAIVETQVELTFRARISYDDPGATVYDKEDGRTYVFNTINEKVEQSTEFPLEVTVHFDPSDESWCDFDIGRLNEGQDFEVSPRYEM